MIASHQCAGSKETVELFSWITYSWLGNFAKLDFKQFGREKTTQMWIRRLLAQSVPV